MKAMCLCFENHQSQALNRQQGLHTHDFYELIICTKGAGRQRFADRRLPIVPRDIYFYPAGVPHSSFCEEGEAFSLIVVYFNDEFLSGIQEDNREMTSIVSNLTDMVRTEPKLQISEAGAIRAERLLEELLSEHKLRDAGFFIACRHIVWRLFLTFLRDTKLNTPLSRSIPSPNHSHTMEQVVQFLHANYGTQISIQDVMDISNLSRSHFHASFKRFTGRTCIDYLNSVRIAAVRRLLENTEYSVTEAAYKCGFQNLSHFYQLFRRETGSTPSALRIKNA
jgi:AraC-like DNA-binding protein/uncharacterized RmlC-like cupin family protein